MPHSSSDSGTPTRVPFLRYLCRRLTVASILAFSLGFGRIGYELHDDLDPATAPPKPTSGAGEMGIVAPTAARSWQIQFIGSIDGSLDVPFYVVDMDVTAAELDALHRAGRFVAQLGLSTIIKNPTRDDFYVACP
jgi:hypothetical protein